MGLFSNLFSKQTCELCGKEVGALGRTKLKDGLYICKDCKKDTSAFFKAENYTLEQVKKHIEYMKKQNELYEKEFATLPKDKIFRSVHQGYYGVAFADDLGMFEIILPETSKRNYKELFRYDQIKDYEVYGKENISTEPGTKKYAETGLLIKMNCAIDLGNVSSSEEARQRMHPYAFEFVLPVDKNTDNKNGGPAKNHLNKIFGRADETLFGSIKESFTGTKHQQAGFKAAGDALGALGSYMKSQSSGSEEDKAAAQEKINAALESGMDYLSENRSQYAKVADEVERRTIGTTFREFLYND